MLILIICLLGAIGIGFWLGYQVYWSGDCVLSQVVVIISIVFIVLFYIISLLLLCDVKVFRQNATIFTVTCASIYITYLTWSTMTTDHDSECSLNVNGPRNTVWQIIVGLLFTFVTILSIATASETQMGKDGANSTGAAVIAERTEDCKQSAEQKEANIFPVTMPTVIF